MGKRIALVPMAAKPYTVGHDGLVRLAAQECDEVRLFVSTSDRFRPGEPLVSGSDMVQLWQKFIERSLPSNVMVSYGGSPVANVWKEVDSANKAGSTDEYVIYSDTSDSELNWPTQTLSKYGGELYGKGLLSVRPVNRSETTEISGTQMRQYLEKGDKREFMKGLPKCLQHEEVWQMLHNTAKNPPANAKRTTGKKKSPRPQAESMLRQLVRLLLQG